MRASEAYDLTAVAGTAPASNRGARWLLCAFGIAFLAGRSGGVLPDFFERPHALWVCGKGACSLLPASEYWIGLSLFTRVFLFVGSILLAAGLLIGRGGPVRLEVGPAGLRFTLRSGKAVRAPWPSRWATVNLVDYHEAPRSMQQVNPAGFVQVGARSIPLTGAAVDGILSGAKSAGHNVRSSRADAAKTSADPGFIAYHFIEGPVRRAPRAP